MAFAISREESLTPWEGIQWGIDRSHYWAQYIDRKIMLLLERSEGEFTDDILKLLEQSRKERTLGGKLSTSAVHAGILAAAERNNAENGTLVVTAITAMLDMLSQRLDLTPDDRNDAIAVAHETLLAVEAGDKTDAD